MVFMKTRGYKSEKSNGIMAEEIMLTDEQKQQVEEKLQKASDDGRIQCAAALGIAKIVGVPSKEVGKMADSLKLRICKCQLGADMIWLVLFVL